MFEIQKLSYSIRTKNILRNISFSLSPGDFSGLLGPNGSGKTTVIRALSGVADYEGSIFLNGKDLKSYSRKEAAKVIAVVPQEAHFAFPFSAHEIVLMGRMPHQKHFAFDSKEDLAIAQKAMELTDCAQFADRAMDTLSGGEKQRVLLARALTQKPKILLLDEPASHLDLAHQQSLFKLLKKLNEEEGITILCVVHDLNIASLCCKKLLFLKEGELKVQGTVAEVANARTIRDIFGTDFRQITDENGHAYFFPPALLESLFLPPSCCIF